jgi:glycosyltransferase involved in cell wall biosynthesis
VRIGIDGRSLRASARSRGIARYVRQLVSALSRRFPEDAYALLVPGRPGPSIGGADLGNVELHTPRVSSRLLFSAAAVAGRPRIDRLVRGCDVVFAPAVAPLAISPTVPLVLTVHDLTFEHRPGDFSAYDRTYHSIARPRRLAQRAQRLIAVSEAVRRDVLIEWDVPAEKVVTIRSGPGNQPGEPGSLPAGVPERYMLAVGALEPRKSPELLVEAHARARASGLASGLVLAGEGPLRNRLADSEAIVLGFVPDGVLDALYRNAVALVCVSREEGFSFTPLEAAARGTPAIVSDLPVFTETIGDGALRVPPGNADLLADALLRVEREPRLREELVRAGQAAMGALSWDRAAIRTREVLRQAAGGEPETGGPGSA